MHWISEETTYCESKNDFFKKSRALDHVPIVQTGPTAYRFGRHLFFLPGMDEKGLRCPGWDIVHVRWSSILGKWDGIILKQHFGGYFTKRPIFCARKMEKGISVRQKGKLPPEHCSPYQCPHACIIWARHHKLCCDSAHNIGHLDRKP